MCFLYAADVDTFCMKESLEFFLLVADPFCIPLHDVNVRGLFVLFDFWPVAVLTRPLAPQDETKGPPVAEGGLL